VALQALSKLLTAFQRLMTALDPTAKAIADLDNLLQLLCKGVKTSTPWERALHELLTQADRQMLIVRLSVSMEASSTELIDSARVLFESLRAADIHLSKGRCDESTRAAVKLAKGLAQNILKRLQSTES
jgi:hypothetical protein